MNTYSITRVTTPYSDDGNKNFSFSLDSYTDCFCFYSFSDDPPEGTLRSSAYFVSVQLVNGSNEAFPEYEYQYLYRDKISPLLYIGNYEGHMGFSLPIVDSDNPLQDLVNPWSGSSGYEGNNIPDFKIAERITQPGALQVGYRLKVNPVLYTAVSGDVLYNKRKSISAALHRVSNIYNVAGITCEINALKIEPLPPGTVISDDFNDPQTAAIINANAKPDELTVILVDNLKVHFENEVGISGGIPGPQGFVNNYAAVLVKLSNHANDPFNLDNGLMGITIAHEMAHYLGLTHESAQEQSGNLMMTRANRSKGNLTAGQIFILNNMPLVDIIYADRELLLDTLTPVTELEIAISTGTNSYPGASNQNQNMVLQFSLGSDEGGFQNWVLEQAPDHYLQPGTSQVFQLQNPSGLFMEELATWKIHCDWSMDTLYPMNFLALSNYWDFSHIQITANGTIIENTDVNAVLSWMVQPGTQRTFKTN